LLHPKLYLPHKENRETEKGDNEVAFIAVLADWEWMEDEESRSAVLEF
jgi:hypothetical protein